MDVRHVNPFIEAFTNIMPILGFVETSKGTLSKKDKNLVSSGVICIVGIVGDIKGNVVYSIDTDDAIRIASKMMMGMELNSLDDMAKSAISELTNMLTANSATCFCDIDINVDISTPTLLHGENIMVNMSSDKVLCVELFADGIPINLCVAFDR